ncbi:MAG TPA: hypothetical protein VNE17_08545 [Nitrolancea sp.]|nr:hypothetical protein [Nitrolancea sp.]
MVEPAVTIDRDVVRPAEQLHDRSTLTAERRLPYIWRVATIWTNVADLPLESEGEMRYFARAPFTGSVATTAAGRDVSFSDLEVR